MIPGMNKKQMKQMERQMKKNGYENGGTRRCPPGHNPF